jgi:DNA-binding transcriptional ArsR family regulator
MSETASVPAVAQSPPPPLALDRVLFAISDKTRWRILRKLSDAGEPLMVKEIAKALGRRNSIVAKHLAVLRDAGITQVGRGRLQQIVPQLVPDPSAQVLDLGYVQLRLGLEEP